MIGKQGPQKVEKELEVQGQKRNGGLGQIELTLDPRHSGYEAPESFVMVTHEDALGRQEPDRGPLWPGGDCPSLPCPCWPDHSVPTWN